MNVADKVNLCCFICKLNNGDGKIRSEVVGEDAAEIRAQHTVLWDVSVQGNSWGGGLDDTKVPGDSVW